MASCDATETSEMPSKIRAVLQIGPHRFHGPKAIAANLMDHIARHWGVARQDAAMKVFTAGGPIYKRVKAAIACNPEDNHVRFHMWRERRGVKLRESRYKRFLRDAGCQPPQQNPANVVRA